MKRNLLCIYTIVLSVLFFSGCGKYYFEEDETTESIETLETEQAIQYELNYVDDYACQSEFYCFKGISRSSKGYYFIFPSFDHRFNEDYMLYFYDIEKNISLPLCSRTDCDHMDINNCSARFGEDMYQRFLMFYGDKLYFIRLADDGGYLVSRDEDGSNFRQIEKMWDSNAFYVNTSTENYGGTPRINNGYIYYTVTEDNTKVFVYRLKLDGSEPKEKIYEFEKNINFVSNITIRCDNTDIYISYLDDTTINYYGKIVLFNENDKSITDIYYNDENGRSEWADGTITSIKTINGLLIYRTQTGVCSYNYKTGENKKITDANSLDGADDTYVYSSVHDSNKIIITEINENSSVEISYSDLIENETLDLSGVDDRFLIISGSFFNRYILNKNAIGKDGMKLIRITPDRVY